MQRCELASKWMERLVDIATEIKFLSNPVSRDEKIKSEIKGQVMFSIKNFLPIQFQLKKAFDDYKIDNANFYSETIPHATDLLLHEAKRFRLLYTELFDTLDIIKTDIESIRVNVFEENRMFLYIQEKDISKAKIEVNLTPELYKAYKNMLQAHAQDAIRKLKLDAKSSKQKDIKNIEKIIEQHAESVFYSLKTTILNEINEEIRKLEKVKSQWLNERVEKEIKEVIKTLYHNGDFTSVKHLYSVYNYYVEFEFVTKNNEKEIYVSFNLDIEKGLEWMKEEDPVYLYHTKEKLINFKIALEKLFRLLEHESLDTQILIAYRLPELTREDKIDITLYPEKNGKRKAKVLIEIGSNIEAFNEIRRKGYPENPDRALINAIEELINKVDSMIKDSTDDNENEKQIRRKLLII